MTARLLLLACSALLWGRWHLQLQQVWLAGGAVNPLYQRIVQTHWLRVGIVTAFAIVELWAAAKPFAVESSAP